MFFSYKHDNIKAKVKTNLRMEVRIRNGYLDDTTMMQNVCF